MKNAKLIFIWPCCMLAFHLMLFIPPSWGSKYELTRNSVEKAKDVDAHDISLFRVKLGDSEAKAVESLVERRLAVRGSEFHTDGVLSIYPVISQSR